MRCFNYLEDVVVWAPAKINLFLEVLKKRLDGYHELQTLMVALELFDTLVLQPDSGDLTLTCTHPGLSTGSENLVLKAARLLQEQTGCSRGAKIRLVKRIPMAAGLAGGSTDAAATLLGLNRLWKLSLSTDELTQLAGRIGSDVAFFLHTPAAWCTGRGELVTPTATVRSLHLVLVFPTFGMPTGPVYQRLRVPDSPHSGTAARKALAMGDVDTLAESIFNRLETPAKEIDGRMGEYLGRLRRHQPSGSLMSGSGSTMFAVCRSPQEAETLAQNLRLEFSAAEATICVTRTCR